MITDNKDFVYFICTQLLCVSFNSLQNHDVRLERYDCGKQVWLGTSDVPNQTYFPRRSAAHSFCRLAHLAAAFRSCLLFLSPSYVQSPSPQQMCLSSILLCLSNPQQWFNIIDQFLVSCNLVLLDSFLVKYGIIPSVIWTFIVSCTSITTPLGYSFSP